MASNASIYNLIRQPQAPQNPIEQYGQTLQLKNLIGQSKLQERAIAEDEATRQAYAESGGDLVKLKELLYGKGLYKPAQAVEKFTFEKRKSEGDIKKTELETLGLQTKQLRDVTARLKGPEDLPILAEATARIFGPDSPALKEIPQGFNNLEEFKQWQLQEITDADSALKQVLAAQAQEVTKRGQDITAATTRRGQDKPVWDTDRGVFIPQPGTSGVRGTAGVSQAGTQPSVIPVPNLPKTQKQIKEEEAKSKLDALARNRADIVINKVDEALKQTGFFTTGLTGATLGLIPGTSAYDLDSTIDTIKANVGFKELQDMRSSSPTGGALGQIAVKELEFLQAAIASLNKGQSREKVEQNLRAVKTHFENWKRTVEQAKSGTQAPITQQPPVERKEIGGKSYIKQNGQWFEE